MVDQRHPMAPTSAPAGIDGTTADAIRATVLDYFEGWFDGDTERMRRALHPGLAKRSPGPDPGWTRPIRTSTADDMIRWTGEGGGAIDAAAGRDLRIDIADVARDIASVVVHSATYIEYLHLRLTPDGWRIVNALWRHADGHGPSS
jgi:Putative lumazine-binding